VSAEPLNPLLDALVLDHLGNDRREPLAVPCGRSRAVRSDLAACPLSITALVIWPDPLPQSRSLASVLVQRAIMQPDGAAS